MFPNEVRCGGESVQGHSPEDGKGVRLQRGSQHPCWAREVQRRVQLLHKGGRSRGSTPKPRQPPRNTSQRSARFPPKGTAGTLSFLLPDSCCRAIASLDRWRGKGVRLRSIIPKEPSLPSSWNSSEPFQRKNGEMKFSPRIT